MANLDIVDTCDSADAHLARALANPTCAMLPHTSGWRHGLDPQANAWYPSMRLLRQSARGEWASVPARVAQALREAVPPLASQALGAAHAGALKQA